MPLQFRFQRHGCVIIAVTIPVTIQVIYREDTFMHDYTNFYIDGAWVKPLQTGSQAARPAPCPSSTRPQNNR